MGWADYRGLDIKAVMVPNVVYAIRHVYIRCKNVE